MEELSNKATDLEQGQLMSATVVMSLLANLQEFVRITGSGLEMHQFVRVSPDEMFEKRIKRCLSNVQYVALIFPIHLMGELLREATGLEIEQATSATVAMSLLVYLQEYVRTMGSGLEMHQLVKVSWSCNYNLIGSDKINFLNLVRCPNLPNPSNGRVNQRGNKPGDRASYTCNSGYELQGDSTRICQNNGQWSGDAPTCERESMRKIWLVDCKQML